MKKNIHIDKIATSGLFLTAIFSPCCFPLLGIGLIALGFGSFELFGTWTMFVFQGFVLGSIVGLLISYRKHRCSYPLLIAIPSGLLIFYGYHFNNSTYWIYFIYFGMLGLLIATGVNYYRNKLHCSCATCTTYKGRTVELLSTLTCPNCGHKKQEVMPTDACAYFYECEECKVHLKPLKGDCCVYCSYGTVACPSVQTGDSCC